MAEGVGRGQQGGVVVLMFLGVAAAMAGCQSNPHAPKTSESGAPGAGGSETTKADGGSLGALGGASTAGGTSSMIEPAYEDPNELSSAELFTCSGATESSPARLRRIGRQEWAASIGRAGTDSRLNPLSKDPAHQYSTYARGESLDVVTLERFMDFAPDSVVGWGGPSDCSCAPQPEGIGCIYQEGVPDDECVRHYVHSYLEGYVLFRAPTGAQVDRLTSFASQALQQEESNAIQRSQTMAQINSAAWLSVAALFRSELGEGNEVSPGVVELSFAEFAKTLAYTLTDHGPGAPDGSSGVRLGGRQLLDLVEARDDGSVLRRETIERTFVDHFAGIEAERNEYASEYWMSAKLGRFFREWLGTGVFRTSFHDDPQATSGLDAFSRGTCTSDEDCPTKWNCSDAMCRPHVNGSFSNLKSGNYGHELTLDDQLGEMIARIVVGDENVLKELLTSRTFFIPSSVTGGQKYTTAPQFVYNVTEEVPAEREARWWQAPADERSGILTHPAWLASHGDNFENGTSAIHRGLWMRKNLLCGVVPDVPVNVDAKFSEDTAHLAARERLEIATDSGVCQNCHSLMNPLGLPFEIYNHAGFLRASDHGAEPSGQSILVATGDPSLDVPVQDAIEMSEVLAESELVEQCFIRQVFRYFAGRPETKADACILSGMQQAYDESGGSLRAMLVELMSSPAIQTRHTPLAGAQP